MPPTRSRVLTEAECVALAERVFRLKDGRGETRLRIISSWDGALRWSQNGVTAASDRQETRVEITRLIGWARGVVTTNQLDAATLDAAAREADHLARHAPAELDDLQDTYLFTAKYPASAIWSDATYQLTVEGRRRVAEDLIGRAEASQMLSAGYVATEAQAYAVISSRGRRLYAAQTQARCAMTVRDRRGTGSGWAGKTFYDWSKIDAAGLARRALQKCIDSRDPAAVEPGRYTVILEPQAVADLLSLIIDDDGTMSRGEAEQRVRSGAAVPHPFGLRSGFSKLGLKVADERVTIGQDPTDPQLGVLPFAQLGDGNPHRAVNWIERGVLTALAYGRPGDRYSYQNGHYPQALKELSENLGLHNSYGFRMIGGETPIEEMIATTGRGLLATRFSGVRRLDHENLLSTGLTRDGLWLIERGKITRPVKNLRFMESPLFVLNSLEQIGPAEPVFRPGDAPLLRPAVVPPLKVRDFNFLALAEAV